jgi:hypothetical protein
MVPTPGVAGGNTNTVLPGRLIVLTQQRVESGD